MIKKLLNTATITFTLSSASAQTIQGSISASPFKIYDRIPYTARATNFHFQYRYRPMPLDTGLAYVELTKWNTSVLRRDTIAWVGFATYTTVNAWTTGSFPLIYLP